MQWIKAPFIIFQIIMIYSSFSFSCSEDGAKGIVPENDLWVGTETKNQNDMTEDSFNGLIDKVINVYKPIFQSEGGRLKVERKWSSGKVNAFASRSFGVWKISMYGGLARHKDITNDAFTLVVCHEVGHHLGGAPKKTRSAGRGGIRKRWATNEGQADYWATSKCLRRVWRGEDHKKILEKLDIPESVKLKCSEQFSTQEELLLCQRSSMAGLSTAQLFHSLRELPKPLSFETSDTAVVNSHFHGHPMPQCRLDTYFQGALCILSELEDVDQSDALVGNCNRIQGEILGVRPLCWFKPDK